MHNDEGFGIPVSHHHGSPNMLIPDEPVNYFRKMNSQPDSQQQQQQQSFHNELNIHRPHSMNLAPFERRIDGISISTHHNGHSIMDEAAVRSMPPQLHSHHHRQQFEVPPPPLIRMKRNVASQVEPNDDGHEIDNEQPVRMLELCMVNFFGGEIRSYVAVQNFSVELLISETEYHTHSNTYLSGQTLFHSI